MSIELRNINKSFVAFDNTRLEILKNLNLHVKESEIIAVVGPSGSGKSTLLSLLCGIESPDQGEIWMGKDSLHERTEEDLTRIRGEKIGIVFQYFHLVPHLTALENVELPIEINRKKLQTRFTVEEFKSRALNLLKSMGLSRRLEHKPAQLSGGESQRVAIARAVAHKPHLLLADEPTGNLDIKTGHEVSEFLFSILKQERITSIIVTHNMELAKRCDRIYELRDGQLIEAI